MNTNSPIVSVKPLEKYTVDADTRIHTEYTPATAPLSLTVSVTLVELE